MKQKLLNSFTWRASLLVALLSCAFSSAWGQNQSELTFSNEDRSVKANDNDVTWSISEGSNYSNKEWSGSNFSLTATSSITGKITKVVVHAKTSQKNNSKITLTVKDTDDNTNIYTDTKFSNSNYANHEFSPSKKINGTDKIVVKLEKTGGNATLTVDKITVTYESAPQFTISDACHGIADEKGNVRNFGTYSYEYPFKVPAATIGENGNNDLKVFTINVEGDALHLNQLSEGTIVPANTGVLVSATAGGTYAAVSTLASGEALEDNLLVASSVAMSGNYKNYHLSMKGGNIGFYWGAANGGTFDIDENKAYLAVPTSSGIKGFAFGDGTNGIQAIENEKAESNAIYNLAGQRVSKMQKGLYIVNGKKMIQR